ncbi:MAG TPA: HDOD domain-containing protein [Leptospiraceae bacterium]|nr:HDOD domain-containing protein [Leptospiraceae bacterium]
MIPYNVFISDDSISERKLIQQFLKSADFKVIGEAEGGEETIHKIKELNGQVDILCVDYSMPEKNGGQVIEEIRTFFPKLIIILITAFSEKEIVEEAVRLKVNAFILKPITKSAIYEKLTFLLGRRDLTNKMVVGYKQMGINLNEIQIPPLRDVMNRVITFDSKKSGGSKELEMIIAPDKALSADILRVANSAYYGRSGSVDTLQNAITLIGLGTIRNIVILQFRKNFTKNLPQPLFRKHLNEIPILTGLIGIDLTGPLNLKNVREQIVISSILRKVGMSILAQNLKLKYLDILKLFEYGSKPLVQLEKEELNIDHIQIGIKVFQMWKLPNSLKKVVANQGFTQEETSRVEDIDRILRMAEILSLSLLGITISEEDSNILKSIMNYYNVTEELTSLFNEEYYTDIKSHPFFDSI